MPKIGIAEKRRAQLISATLECVDQHGVEGATISKISKQAGVSNGIVHHYFHDKDELLEATMRVMLIHLRSRIDVHFKEAKNPRDRVLAIIAGTFPPRQIEMNSAKIWLSFWSEAIRNPNLSRLQAVYHDRLLSNLIFHLKQILPGDKARLVATGLAAQVDGLWLSGALNKDGVDIANSITVCRSFLDCAIELHSNY